MTGPAGELLLELLVTALKQLKEEKELNNDWSVRNLPRQPWQNEHLYHPLIRAHVF